MILFTRSRPWCFEDDVADVESSESPVGKLTTAGSWCSCVAVLFRLTNEFTFWRMPPDLRLLTVLRAFGECGASGSVDGKGWSCDANDASPCRLCWLELT